MFNGKGKTKYFGLITLNLIWNLFMEYKLLKYTHVLNLEINIFLICFGKYGNFLDIKLLIYILFRINFDS